VTAWPGPGGSALPQAAAETPSRPRAQAPRSPEVQMAVQQEGPEVEPGEVAVLMRPGAQSLAGPAGPGSVVRVGPGVGGLEVNFGGIRPGRLPGLPGPLEVRLDSLEGGVGRAARRGPPEGQGPLGFAAGLCHQGKATNRSPGTGAVGTSWGSGAPDLSRPSIRKEIPAPSGGRRRPVPGVEAGHCRGPTVVDCRRNVGRFPGEVPDRCRVDSGAEGRHAVPWPKTLEGTGPERVPLDSAGLVFGGYGSQQRLFSFGGCCPGGTSQGGGRRPGGAAGACT
jgi:hypothetical protein